MKTLGSIVKEQDFSSKLFPLEAKFSGVYKDCNFLMARMFSADIYAHFYECNMRGVFLTGATFFRTKFYNCHLNSADMRRAKFQGTSFYGCDLRGVNFQEAIGLTGCFFDEDCLLDNVNGVAVSFDPDNRLYMISPYSNGVPNHVPFERTKKMIGPAVEHKKKPEKVIQLVEPEKLPPVSHYRSAPMEVIPESDADWDEYDIDDSDQHACAYGYYPAYNFPTTEEKRNRYGYGESAVLECSDIGEYDELTK